METQQAHDQIRLALETRLRHALRTDAIPPMSIGEMVSLLFAMFGQLDILGGYGPTMAAIHRIVGQDLLWRKPEAVAAPAVN